MPSYKVMSIVNEQPTFEKPLNYILDRCEVGGAIKYMSPRDYHTDQQRKWIKGVCIRGLAEWNGDTEDEWDLRLKAECNGNELLKKETIYLGPGTTCIRLTIVGVGKKKLTAYIENILSKAIEKEWPVNPPDSDLRK